MELAGLGAAHLAGQRAADLLVLGRLMPIASIYACEGGPDAVALASKAGAALHSPELVTKHRRKWSNRDMDELARLVAEPLEGTVVLYAPSRAWDIATRPPATPVAVPADVFDAVDDKIVMRTAFAELGLPVLPWEVCDRDAACHGQWPHTVGWPVVVQAPRGSSGHETVIVHDLECARSAIAALRAERVLVSRHIAGAVLNIHLVVSDADLFVASTSVQLSGVPGLSVSPAEYAGNDLGAAQALPVVVRRALRNQVHLIAGWLRTAGVRGLVGVDFLRRGGEVWPLEVNPRLQGSTALVSAAEDRAGCFPTVGRHVLELTGSGGAAPPAVNRPRSGAQLVLRQRGAAMPAAVRPGVYNLERGTVLRFAQRGAQLTDCRVGQVLVHSVPPYGLAEVEEGAVIARLSTWDVLVEPASGSLNGRGRALVAAANRLFTPRGRR